MSETEQATTTEGGLPLDAATLPEAFQATVGRFPDAVALRTPGGGVEITWREYGARVERVAAGLAALGVGRGDTVASMLVNRPEALIVDTAVMHLGATPFAIYNTSSPEQIEYLLGHAASTVVVTEAQFVERVLAERAKLPALREVVVVDGSVPGTRSLDELEQAGEAGFDLEATWRAVEPDDVATLIYTSGTTGAPKGVELTHRNLLFDLGSIHAVHPLRPQGRLISWLPLAHAVDRAFSHYLSMVTGSTVTCLADARQVVATLPDARPTAFLAVPRIWEKLRAALEPAIAADPSMKAHVAGNLGLDDADLIMSGAAPIAPEVLEFLAEVGIDVYEGWGMSEATIATISPKGEHRVGTVGKALPGFEVVLADDGELLIRSPGTMRGYRKDPEKTAEAIDAEGWMHTGDIGEIDDDGYVKIVDRKKELIINAAGKNMSPANIENTIKAACPLIGCVVAIGDRRPYNTALVTLDPDAAAAFEGDPTAAVAAGIEAANEQLSRVEQIKKHTLLPGAWEPGGDELTPTMKLKRKPIAEKYAAVINAMYAE